jgi:hypothetical protein
MVSLATPLLRTASPILLRRHLRSTTPSRPRGRSPDCGAGIPGLRVEPHWQLGRGRSPFSPPRSLYCQRRKRRGRGLSAWACPDRAVLPCAVSFLVSWAPAAWLPCGSSRVEASATGLRRPTARGAEGVRQFRLPPVRGTTRHRRPGLHLWECNTSTRNESRLKATAVSRPAEARPPSPPHLLNGPPKRN